MEKEKEKKKKEGDGRKNPTQEKRREEGEEFDRCKKGEGREEKKSLRGLSFSLLSGSPNEIFFRILCASFQGCFPPSSSLSLARERKELTAKCTKARGFRSAEREGKNETLQSDHIGIKIYNIERQPF